MSAPKGHTAVRAAKKPGKLSSGEVWEKLELYPTPPWATRALFEHVLPAIGAHVEAAWDPCAGLGHMSAVISEYVERWHASDVHLYDLPSGQTTEAFEIEKDDSLDRYCAWPFLAHGWIITNPPFVPAVDMLEKALALDGVEGVAFLLRLQWLTTEGRYERIFSKTPPLVIAPFVERVAMCLGGYDPSLSSATDYAWFVWAKEPDGRWNESYYRGGFNGWLIPPCRNALTRESDRLLAQRCVPGFTPPSTLKKTSKEQLALV